MQYIILASPFSFCSFLTCIHAGHARDAMQISRRVQTLLLFFVTLYRIAPRKAIRVTIILLVVATTTITIFEFFWTLFCNLWEGPAVEDTCHAENTWGISLLVHGGVLLIVDLALGNVIPVVVFRKLQMRKLLRISVGVTIAVGSPSVLSLG